MWWVLLHVCCCRVADEDLGPSSGKLIIDVKNWPAWSLSLRNELTLLTCNAILLDDKKQCNIQGHGLLTSRTIHRRFGIVPKQSYLKGLLWYDSSLHSLCTLALKILWLQELSPRGDASSEVCTVWQLWSGLSGGRWSNVQLFIGGSVAVKTKESMS